MATATEHPLLALTASEIEFLAEDEVVTITPNFALERQRFLAGRYGPFRPSVPTRVPLWLAVTLKKRGKCKIKIPEWLEADALNRALEEERRSEMFSALPFHYREMASLLLNYALDDIPNLHRVRTLLEDLENIRQAKTRKGLLKWEGHIPAVKLNNLSSMEIAQVRPFAVQALGKFHELDPRDGSERGEHPSEENGETGEPLRRIRRR